MRKRNLFTFLSLIILFISTIFTLKIEITYRKFIDSYFIISGLSTSLFLFKLLLDKGAFDTFRYSWHKTRPYFFFFLPRYNHYDKNDDTIQTFDDYLIYKEKKIWKNLHVLILTSLFHLSISMIFSFSIYYF